MLILTRKSRQCVTIDGNIHITILSIKGKNIIMGFDAPEHISIVRDDCKNITNARNEQARDGTFLEGII